MIHSENSSRPRPPRSSLARSGLARSSLARSSLARSGAAGAAAVLLGLAFVGPSAHASPLDLPGGCAVAHAALRGGGGNRLDADRLEVSLAAQPGAVLHASHLSASLQNAALPPGALAQASTAAAAALLVAATGHHDGSCPDQVLQDAVAPLAQAISGGGHAAFTWTGVSIRSGDKRMGAAKLALHLDGGDGHARVSLSIDGAVSNDPASALLPDSLAIAAGLPADQVPALLSAAGGHGAPVDLTIDHVHARRGPTVLDGSGHARIAAAQSENSGTGHVTVSGFDALLDAAGTSGLEKLRTGLFLAKLMAHRQGDQAEWDLNWQGATLLVNNVPLPLR